MTQANGVVSNSGKKVIKGRTYFNFFLENDDNLYRCGTKDPGVGKGDVIEFEYEENEYGINVDIGTIKVVGSAPKPTAKQAAKKGSGGGGREDYWNNKETYDHYKQLLISRQAATNTAVDVVKLALEHGDIDLGKTKNKQMGVLKTYIFEVAEELFDHNHEGIFDNLYGDLSLGEEADTEAAAAATIEGGVSDD